MGSGNSPWQENPRSSAAMLAPGSTPSPQVHLCPLVFCPEVLSPSSTLSLSGNGGEGRKSDLGPGHCLLSSETRTLGPQLAASRHTKYHLSIPSISPRCHCACSLSWQTAARPQHFGSVFSCNQSGARMSGKRKRSMSGHTVRRQTPTNRESILPEQPPRSPCGPGMQKPARSYLGCSSCIPSLAIARSMVSSPTSHVCRGTCCAEGTGSSDDGLRARSGQFSPSKKVPPTLGVPCASTSAGESASRRGGPRRHTHAGRLGFVAQTRSTGNCVGQWTSN